MPALVSATSAAGGASGGTRGLLRGATLCRCSIRDATSQGQCIAFRGAVAASTDKNTEGQHARCTGKASGAQFMLFCPVPPRRTSSRLGRFADVPFGMQPRKGSASLFEAPSLLLPTKTPKVNTHAALAKPVAPHSCSFVQCHPAAQFILFCPVPPRRRRCFYRQKTPKVNTHAALAKPVAPNSCSFVQCHPADGGLQRIRRQGRHGHDTQEAYRGFMGSPFPFAL